jgi:hypothetical protein
MFKIKEEEKQRQIREANEVFEKILRISSKTKEEIYYVPRNLNEQKKLFLENKILNPKFKYLKTPYNPNREIERLKKIKVNRKNKFYKFLKEIIEEKILNLENTKNLGDSNKRLKISLQKYGKTKKRLVKKAKKDLEKLKGHVREKKEISAKEISKALEKAIKSYGIQVKRGRKKKEGYWNIIGRKKPETSIDPLLKEISYCKKRMFSKESLKRLPNHEISRHLLSAENASIQPIKIFRTGVRGYLPTEEGLAMWCEEQTKTLDLTAFQKYAARYLLADLAIRKKTFRECFQELIKYGIDADEAWETTKRCFYGGDGKNPSSVKVQVYYQGYHEIKDFLKKNKKINKSIFWIGKFKLKDLKIITKLLKQGYLTKPKYLPYFIK